MDSTVDVYVLCIVLYVAGLLLIGFYKSRTVKTQDDFMVAGRKTGAWFLVATLVSTWIGSGSLFGSAGLAFRTGFSGLWMSAGAWAAILIMYFLAERVRRISEYTLSDILEKRYNSTARLLGTFTIFIAYMTIAGYQFRGGGRLLNIITGIDPVLGAGIVCVVAILFTVTAGMVSIISVDMFNGIVMAVGVVLAIPLALAAVGGASQLGTLPSDRFALFGENNALWAAGVFFPSFFLLLSEGSIYQKFFTAKDERTARRAVVGMIIGVIILESALAGLGIIGSTKYHAAQPFVHADGSVNQQMSETIILYLARFDLPVFAGALLFCAAVAIILSTANSFLMIPSTNITRDVYQRFLKPDAAQETLVKLQRMLIVGIGICSFIIANFFPTILAMAFTAFSMVGAGLAPALLAAFLWKRVTIQGGVASIAAGMGVTLILTILNMSHAEPVVHTDYIILPAALASIVSLVAVSLMTPPSPESKWAPFMTTLPGKPR